MAEFKHILDRKGFIEYWVEYMKKHTDQEWSREQNMLINSVLKTCRQPSREEYMDSQKKCIVPILVNIKSSIPV